MVLERQYPLYNQTVETKSNPNNLTNPRDTVHLIVGTGTFLCNICQKYYFNNDTIIFMRIQEDVLKDLNSMNGIIRIFIGIIKYSMM